MELAVGSIVTGKVTTITKFGAFIALPGGKSGLVHISEVAPTFVNDVHDFLAEGQEVSVKILAITPEGKINLSVKQALPKPERPERPTRRESAPRRAAQPAPVPAEPAEQTFEDKLKQFMSVSDSKQSELNRYMAGKRGGSRRRK
ncbi:MAG: S1 RNA-binding domain-containing protein [Firmicutes bacterium]|jgi:S1 RNA binding domain protein|nr:S1 RNA-binding domain-containing protein [Clostridiales bacterium]MBS1337266.1 S1 RNA-binding domain-containing protein [Oscillospiraceae bacterium]MBS6310332.1 S1 RNA-binding domain-containing protein [Bacillota bacterium]HCO51422.1 RNA-binding protein S1 [Oscillibacter sp.]HCX44939.1 RNA-binding protein S1 [Oscillibacter sp.]